LQVNDPARDALQQVESAAHLYAAGEDDIAAFREILARQHPNDRGTYACAALDRVITDIAFDHRTECDGGADCRTCAGLRDALTVAVASVRSMIADEMTWRNRRNRRWFWNR
jgi:hypothetical protein